MTPKRDDDDDAFPWVFLAIWLAVGAVALIVLFTKSCAGSF